MHDCGLSLLYKPSIRQFYLSAKFQGTVILSCCAGLFLLIDMVLLATLADI